MSASTLLNPKVAAILATIVGSRSAAARTTRAQEVVACVRSLLANSYTPLEVVVVDQSPDDTLATTLQPLRQQDARLRYVHTDVPGKSRAQNLAIRDSDADLFVFTDDDCIVPSDWVARTVEVFQRHPDAGLLFGEVRPPAGHDWAISFVPELRIPEEERLQPAFLPRVNCLLGANMAVSRQTFARIGLFDEALGPGGWSGAYNEEVEFALRARRAHVGVYLTPAFPVVHEYGSRPQGEATRRLLRTYQTGKSAMLTKHALRGDVGAACRLILLAFEPFVEGAINVIRTGRPRGVGMIVPYVEGICCGLRVAGGPGDVALVNEKHTASLLPCGNG